MKAVLLCLAASAFALSVTPSAIIDPLDQWVWRGLADPSVNLYDVVAGNDVIVAGGASTLDSSQIPAGRAILFSLNGVSWQNAPETQAPQYEGLEGFYNALPVRGLAYGAGRFVAVQLQDGSLGQYSDNGTDWFAALQLAPAGADVAYGEGMFVSVGPDFYGFSNPAGGSSAMVATSSDGQNWSMLPAPTTNYLWGIAFGQGRFVAVGERGCILVSTNSVDWQQSQSGTDRWLNGVGYGNGRFVATGANGLILVSEDAVVWTSTMSPTSEGLNDVAYAEGTYVIAGGHGTILTSTNGMTWAQRRSGTDNDLLGVTYARDSFIVVGPRGTILQSGVKPFAIRFDDSQAKPTGFEMHLAGEPGRSFRVEASSNLVDWTEISVVNHPTNGVLLLDPSATNRPSRFYRVVAP